MNDMCDWKCLLFYLYSEIVHFFSGDIIAELFAFSVCNPCELSKADSFLVIGGITKEFPAWLPGPTCVLLKMPRESKVSFRGGWA